MPRFTVTAVISNKLGLHARPAMAFVDTAAEFQSSIVVKRTDGQAEAVDGKSIMEIMMLAATKGTELEIIADGEDAEQSATALKKLVDGGFGE
ncbi:MAG: HPr family phosphocarrier protein [Planctomycetota bacterium]